jgi:hypothetical protein
MRPRNVSAQSPGRGPTSRTPQTEQLRFSAESGGTAFATTTTDVVMPQMFPVQSPSPRLDPQWSSWILIVAVLFLVAVFLFYFYVR